MRMDGEADVGGITAGLDRERDLADELAGIRANDAATEHPMSLGIEQELREALFPAQRQGPSVRDPGEAPLGKRNALVFRHRLGEPDPRDLGIRISDRGNYARIEGALLTGGDLGGHLALMHCL